MNFLERMFIKAEAARTTLEDPMQKYNFRLTIPSLPGEIGFQKVSGLTHEVGMVEYREAGETYSRKLAGRPKVSEIVAERGVYSDNYLAELITNALTDPNMRQTVIIEQLSRTGVAARTYKLAEAWVSKWENSDMDASSDDVAIEKITIQFEYYLD